MRHLKRTAKLGRTGQHRNAMLSNLVCSLIPGTDTMELTHKPVPTIRPDLLALFDRHELEKYLTAPELAVLDNPQSPTDVAGEQV